MFSEKQSALKNWNSHFLKLDTNEDGVVSLKELTQQFLCGAPPSPDTYQLSCINQANAGVGSMAAETAASESAGMQQPIRVQAAANQGAGSSGEPPRVEPTM